jgi:hypothetical protein
MKKIKTRQRHRIILLFGILVFAGLHACTNTQVSEGDMVQNKAASKINKISSKPHARYWWFASMMQKEDIAYNLEWLKRNGFGGVEIAWVYSLKAKSGQAGKDTTARQQWLSPEWQDIVEFTIRYADSIGLVCDLTMGTLWPFGDSYVQYEDASQRYGEKERQLIKLSWESPKNGYVVDHIQPKSYLNYFNRILDSFPQPGIKLPQAYFIDSWEVKTDKLWTDGFDTDFEQRYAYDIKPYMNGLFDEMNKAILYDYRKLISDKVIRFYSDYDSILNKNNLLSRGQCSGAPCNIISAYAQLDIPEGESMLYEPEYNSIPASAALLSQKDMVSAESFTCLYGWPRNYMSEEQTADLKLVADALFANGVNKIIWHGKAHNPKNQDSINFYATVHLGDKGSLAKELPGFNHYLTGVSSIMRQGKSYSDVAVYLPTEDAWINGIMPKEKQFIWAKEYYEMRYVYFPQEVAGYHPIWINSEFLNKAVWEDGFLSVGDAKFSSLYVDAQYLDYQVLKRITKLASAGLPVTLKRFPIEAGTIQHNDWDTMLNQLQNLANVKTSFSPQTAPLVESDTALLYWARQKNETLYLFFAHPKSKGLKFPLSYGQSFSSDTIKIPVTLNYRDKAYPLNLTFYPYQSLMYKIENGAIEQVDISYTPKIPVVKKLADNFVAPWLVK